MGSRSFIFISLMVTIAISSTAVLRAVWVSTHHDAKNDHAGIALELRRPTKAKTNTKIIVPNNHANQSIHQWKNERLEFVHITKTGGTSIEKAAAKAGIAWGKCKFKTDKDCNVLQSFQGWNTSLAWNEHNGNNTNFTSCLDDNDAEPYHCPPYPLRSWECRNKYSVPWHCPPTNFRNGINPYESSKTFAIVRNPYDRLLSEYYYATREKRFQEKKSDPLFFNKWVESTLDMVKTHGCNKIGHAIPMHQFTHDPSGKQIVDHILRLENISEEFPKLMKMYGLDEKVELIHANSMNKKIAVFGIYNLTRGVQKKVLAWAKLDCEYFGYDELKLP